MNTLPPLRNRAIAASAGTGKTFQLAHRYIELLRRGVTADRICALTFSRKAAGEIFDAIVACLCAAARDPDKARLSSELLAIPTAPDEFLALLRAFVERLHRLRIGTIDSFTVSVARAFTLELGLSPDFRVGDGEDAEGAELRRELLARLFDPSRTDARDQRAFLEAYKLATFGREDKVIGRPLETFLTTLSGLYRGMRDPSVWGNEQAIWNPSPPWTRLPDERVAACADCLRSAADALPARIAPAARETAALLAAHADLAEWNGKHDHTLFKRFWNAVFEPDGTPLEFSYYQQKARLPPAAADALRALIRHVMAIELARCCRQSRGVARVLEQYERLYRDQAGLSNRMTFDDLTRLLDADGVFRLSRLRAPDRLYIDYRLDGRLDHWLLDEFQDTSDAQWRVLRDLIDETVQDDSGRRSFFYVGDTKQAIYGWRGGNHRLFGEVEARYTERIEGLPLDDSHRSAAPLVDAVNRVFMRAVQEPGIPSPARDEWSKIWRAHRTVRADAGCVELLEAAPESDDAAAGANDALYDVIAGRLQAIRPAARGLQAAVLVRTNEQGRRCVDRLRARCQDQAIVLDGAASLLDNALVPLLLALVRFAAHPGDTLAWRQLQMSPLGALLASGSVPADDEGLRAAWSLRLLHSIHAQGFVASLRAWCGQLETICPLDAFGRRRRDDLFDAATAFDASGDRDCDRFARHVRAYAPRESIDPHAIRVMTIHQSKGLGFDLVFVPFPRSGLAFSNPGRTSLLVATDAAWALLPPPQLVMQTDPVLNAAAERRSADGAFAQLCVFYVALTRAKQGLYLVVPPPTKSESGVCREETVLRHALSGGEPVAPLPDSRVLFRSGAAGWYAGRTPPAATPSATAPPEAASRPAWRSGTPRLVRREPSRLETVTRPAASLFKRETGDVLAFGTAIHRLFQMIEWLDGLDIDASVASWRASAMESATVLRDAERQFRDSLAQPEVRRALTRPAGSCLLWREKPFELMVDGVALAGQFDRVVILCDARGNPTTASILDFKSNRIESDDALRQTADHYREQLGLYAAALRRILGPGLGAVAQSLLFTRAGRVVIL